MLTEVDGEIDIYMKKFNLAQKAKPGLNLLILFFSNLSVAKFSVLFFICLKLPIGARETV